MRITALAFTAILAATSIAHAQHPPTYGLPIEAAIAQGLAPTPPDPLQQARICANLQAASARPTHFAVAVSRGVPRFICPENASRPPVVMHFKDVDQMLAWALPQPGRHVIDAPNY